MTRDKRGRFARPENYDATHKQLRREIGEAHEQRLRVAFWNGVRDGALIVSIPGIPAVLLYMAAKWLGAI